MEQGSPAGRVAGITRAIARHNRWISGTPKPTTVQKTTIWWYNSATPHNPTFSAGGGEKRKDTRTQLNPARGPDRRIGEFKLLLMTQEQGQRPRETRAGKPERPSAVLLLPSLLSPHTATGIVRKEWGVGSGELIY